MQEINQEFWLIWFPCILAAVVIAVLYLVGNLLR
jgi:ABC-type dipeptide/oligopeptide/nickel transport system permease subunit